MANLSFSPNSTMSYFDSNLNNTQQNITEDDGGLDDQQIIANRIYAYVLPFIIIPGSFANIMSFIVMRKGSLKKVSSCFYMAILALSDTGYLWTGTFTAWVKMMTDFKVNMYTWTDCKLIYFLNYFFQHFSSSLLVTMSVEKFFALYFPLKTKAICTVQTAKRVTLILAILYFIYEFQFLFIVDAYTKSDGIKSCQWIIVSEGYLDIMSIIDTLLYSFLPFTIMILANTAIIFKFMIAKYQSKRNGTQSTNQALSKSATKGTVMLVTVTTTFIILTGPVSIGYAMEVEGLTPVVNAIFFCLTYLNHAINGVLYCVVGSRFRNELLKTLHCCKSDDEPSMSGASRTFGSTTTVTNVSEVVAKGSPI